MTLPAALAPMGQIRQFINYIVVPGSRPGKFDKLPVDWRTGHVESPHDPAIWTDYNTARAHSDQVGFVFTEHDPFFFLDIDNCLTPSGWSPLAQELCALLPGAAVEISYSGKGLHVFGVGKVPPHGCRGPAGSGLELYDSKRFVALGKMPEYTTGDVTTDCTAGLQVLVERYFSKVAVAVTVGDWTNGPCEGWRGSTDDDDLIRRARASKSAAGVFGSRACFDDLWRVDVEVMSKAYPDTLGGGAFDESVADAALAQHLAFWTGKDCERIQRIMLMSGLVRDKWKRDDYLPRTIRQAVAQQKDVCCDRRMEDTAPVAAITDIEGATFINPEQQKIMFAGCTYIVKQDAILMPGGHMWKERGFNSMLGGFTFILDRSNSKTTPDAWKAFLQSQVVKFPRAHDTEFRPELEPGKIWTAGNNLLVNSYYPINIEMTDGNREPFMRHMRKLFPVERDLTIVLSFMAAIIQHKGVKFQWAPLIQGAQGNGKSMLSSCLRYAVGDEYSHPAKANQLTKNFNKWMMNRILVTVEDVYVPESKGAVLEALKPMVSEYKQEIEGKGIDQAGRRLCCNFFLNSNHKDALRICRGDRRFAAFFTPHQSYADILRDGMDGSYFRGLYGWLESGGYAIVAHFLANFKIPPEFNPATGDRAPLTSSSEEAVTASMGRLEQEIMNAIQEEKTGFRCGWISSHYLDALIRDVGMDKLIARNKRRSILQEMGYDYHSSFVDGRTNAPVQPDGTKPRLFVKPDHRSIGLAGFAAAQMYSEDQIKGSPSVVS